MILNTRVTLEESHVKMRIETATKREILFASLAVILGFLVSVLVGSIGPSIHLSRSASSFTCNDGGFIWVPENCTGVFLGIPENELVVEISNMDKFDQEFLIIAHIWNSRYETLGINEKMKFSVIMEGRETFESEWEHISGSMGNYHERKITCDQGTPKCKGTTIIHQPHITFSHYRIGIKLDGELSWVGNVDLEFKYVNSAFTTFELWFRLFFLILTSLAGMVFTNQLKSVRITDWAIEQKWVLILLMSLFMYNNPLFPLLIIYDGLLPQLINTSFIFGFICILLLFWLCLIDGYRKPVLAHHFKPMSFYGPKVALVSALWLFSVVPYTMISMFEQDDPAYDTFTDVPGVKPLLSISITLFVIYIVWFGYSLVRTMIDIRDILHIQFRFKFFVIVTFSVMIITVVGMFLGFFGPVRENAITFLVYFSTFNMYVYLLSYMYSSPPRGIQAETDRISMLQTGDDDDDDFGDDDFIELNQPRNLRPLTNLA